MKLAVVTSALLGLILPLASCQDAATGSPALTPEVLSNLDQGQLDAIFHAASPGPIPNGNAQGTAVFFPGTALEKPLQYLSEIVWQGKVFETDLPAGESISINKVFGVRAIIAENYYGNAFYDGLPAIILDYSHSSIVGNRFRDEIREVAPGIYLGRWYIRDFVDLVEVFICNFILDFTEQGYQQYVKSQHPASGAVASRSLRWAKRGLSEKEKEEVEEDEDEAGGNFF